MDKNIKVIAIIALLACAIALFVSFNDHGVLGAGNGQTSHTNSQFDAAGGFSVGGTVAIDASGRVTGNVSSTSLIVNGNATTTGTLVIGNGTAIVKVGCAVTSTALASQAQNATATIDFTLSGVSTSSHQVYSFGVASSSAGWTDIEVVSITPSSTLNRITVETKNLASATFAPGQATFSLCYTQF